MPHSSSCCTPSELVSFSRSRAQERTRGLQSTCDCMRWSRRPGHHAGTPGTPPPPLWPPRRGPVPRAGKQAPPSSGSSQFRLCRRAVLCEGAQPEPLRLPRPKTPMHGFCWQPQCAFHSESGTEGLGPSDSRLQGTHIPGGLGYDVGIPDLHGHGSDTHLDDQVHESLVIIAGDGCVRPNDQGAVNASREVDVLACRMVGGPWVRACPGRVCWVLSTHCPVPPSIQSLAWLGSHCPLPVPSGSPVTSQLPATIPLLVLLPLPGTLGQFPSHADTYPRRPSSFQPSLLSLVQVQSSCLSSTRLCLGGAGAALTNREAQDVLG